MRLRDLLRLRFRSITSYSGDSLPHSDGLSQRSDPAARWLAPLIVLGALAILIGTGALLTQMVITRGEAAAVADAFAHAQVQARLVQAEWTDMLARIESLERLARQVTLASLARDSDAMARLKEELRPAAAMIMPTMVQVGAIDPHGIAMWSTALLPDRPLDLSRTDYVQAIATGRLDHYISAPAMGTLSHRMSIHFADAVREPDGSLCAMTVVSLDISQINTLARGLEPSGQNFVAVLRDDGMVLGQSDGRGIGTNLSRLRPSLPQLLTEENSQARGASQVDGVRRFLVRRAVPGSGTAVVVGLDEAEMLAPARAAAAAMWRWNVLVDVCLAALAALVLRMLHEGARARDERLRHAGYRAQETFLRQIADEAIDLIALLDGSHRFLYVNPACRRLIGAEPAALLGVPASTCVAPDHRPELLAVLESLSVGGKPRRLLVPFVHRSNLTPRWMEIEASHLALPAEEGTRRDGCFFIARDVTERKQAEDALQRAREDLETVARAGPGALYRLALAADGTRRLLFLNDIGLAHLGFTYEEALSPGFFRSVLHPADRPGYEAAIATLRRDGEVTMEYRLQDRDGSFRWIRDTCVVTEAVDGGLVVSGYCSDITREKQQAEQLEQARRLLSLGEMASGLAHELNQPLAAISMAAENGRMLLTSDPASVQTARDKFSRIGALAERAVAIIESMRVFGRANAPLPVPLDVTDTLHDALGVMHARFEREGIVVLQDVPPALPAVKAVPVLLQQVLINLLANACDAYAQGSAAAPGRHISVSAWPQAGTVRIEVADRAGGIPPAALPRVFEPFFTTKAHGGTGMGLAVSFGIIRQLGGSITAVNRAGGAVFEIALPIHRPANPAGDAADQPAAVPASTR